MNIFEAAATGNSKYIKELIREGVDINLKNSEHFTPLMFAAQNGQFETVKLLVNHGAIDSPNCYNNTAAIQARKLGNTEISDFLNLYKTILEKITGSITKLVEKQPLNEEEDYNLTNFFFGLNLKLLRDKINYPTKDWLSCIKKYIENKNAIKKTTNVIIEKYKLHYEIDTISIIDEEEEDDLCYSDSDTEITDVPITGLYDQELEG